MDPLSSLELTNALREVSDELRRRRVKAHLYLIGGAAIALAFNKRRFTLDIDALILDGHGAVMDATQRIARRHGWPESWLNEQAVSAMPKRTDYRARTVYGDANLVVTAASAEHLLAMKVRAARDSDLKDIAFLVQHLGLHSAREVMEVHDEVFPESPLPERPLRNVLRYLSLLWPEDRSLGDRVR